MPRLCDAAKQTQQHVINGWRAVFESFVHTTYTSGDATVGLNVAKKMVTDNLVVGTAAGNLFFFFPRDFSKKK